MRKLIVIFFFILYLFILKYLSQVLMPFIFAFLFYMMMKPVIDYFDSHAISISILALIFLFLVGIGIMLGYSVYQKINQYDIISLLLDIPYFKEFMLSIIELISNMIYQIPNMILSIFIFVISTFFLVIDYKNIRILLMKSRQNQLIRLIVYYKDQCQESMLTYFKCQLILIIICFIHVFFIFSILNIPHSLFYSLISALLDALPMIGIGIVLVPMIAYFLIHEYYLKSLYVLLMLLWLSFLRNILETRMMNNKIQIPSFFLLLSMMLHIHFYGLLGVVLSPIHMNILCNIMLLDEP